MLAKAKGGRMADGISNKLLITLKDLRNHYGIDKSRVSIWRWENAGRFPKRVYANKTSIYWKKSEVDGWLEQILAERHTRAHADLR
jgi:prophage regulatory protein